MLNFVPAVFFRRRFFKTPPLPYIHVFPCKTFILYCGPVLPLELMVLRNLNKHYLKVFLTSHIFICETLIPNCGPILTPEAIMPGKFHKSLIFSSSVVFWGKDFVYHSLIISPWKMLWPFVWTISNSLFPRMLRTKFGWNWFSGFKEEVENL